jgi:hypothetical protein
MASCLPIQLYVNNSKSLLLQCYLIFKSSLYINRSWDSVVSIVTDYGLDDQGVGVGQEFCLLHAIQTTSGVHPTSYPMGTRGSFTRGEVAGA